LKKLTEIISTKTTNMGVSQSKNDHPCKAKGQVEDDEKDTEPAPLERMKKAGVDYPKWEELEEKEQAGWRAKHLSAIGETEATLAKANKQVDGCRKEVPDEQKADSGPQEMMVKLGPVMYPNADKGDAYKKAVTDLTRFYGAVDRVFELGAEKAFNVTVEEFYEGTMNPIKLNNEGNKKRADAKPIGGKSTVTRADVKKTGVTFKVFPDKKGAKKLETVKAESLMNKCHGLGDRNGQIVKEFGFGEVNGFIHACYRAWSEHYPLELSVDDIWILVLMGITTHVEQNAEKLRPKFVNFKGKKTLSVTNDKLKPGDINNDWDTCVDGWVEMINNNLVTNRLNVEYSTTTRMAQIVQRVCVMDCCKSFFAYRCGTCCGFPSVTLRGKKEDWEKLQNDVIGAVEELCLDGLKKQWLPALKSVLPKFIECFDQDYKVDKHFWDSMVKRGSQGGSGSYSWFSGWFNVFYPYLGSGRSNRFCEAYSNNVNYEGRGSNASPATKNWKSSRGPDVGDFPKGMAVAPVEWKYLGADIPVELKAGFVGVAQDPETLALRPALNWCMVEKGKEKKRWD